MREGALLVKQAPEMQRNRRQVEAHQLEEAEAHRARVAGLAYTARSKVRGMAAHSRNMGIRSLSLLRLRRNLLTHDLRVGLHWLGVGLHNRLQQLLDDRLLLDLTRDLGKAEFEKIR
jgi:hypothetical protein